MTSTVKIRTAKAIDILKDSIKSKKTELTNYNKLVAQYKKDKNVWEAKVIREAQKAALSTGRLYSDHGSKVIVLFDFSPTSRSPQSPTQFIAVKEGRYSSKYPKSDVLAEQIQKSEALLTMLLLTEDEFVSAAVYKDIASLI